MACNEDGSKKSEECEWGKEGKRPEKSKQGEIHGTSGKYEQHERLRSMLDYDPHSVGADVESLGVLGPLLSRESQSRGIYVMVSKKLKR